MAWSLSSSGSLSGTSLLGSVSLGLSGKVGSDSSSGSRVLEGQRRWSNGVLSGISKVLIRDVFPLVSLTWDLDSFSDLARNAMSALFAFPSTGGDLILTRKMDPMMGSVSHAMISFCLALGVALMRRIMTWMVFEWGKAEMRAK